NTCIYIRGAQPKVVARFEKTERGEAAISLITFGELSYGVSKSGMPERATAGLNRLVTLLPVLTLPDSAGSIYGALRAALEKQGAIIGPNDLWIAAHAMASDLILVT